MMENVDCELFGLQRGGGEVGAGDAAGVGLEAGEEEAGGAEFVAEGLIAREGQDGIDQIAIGGAAAHQSADQRQDVPEIKQIDSFPEAVSRDCEFQDGQSSAGLEHAADFCQALGSMVEVAQAEGNGYNQASDKFYNFSPIFKVKADFSSIEEVQWDEIKWE